MSSQTGVSKVEYDCHLMCDKSSISFQWNLLQFAFRNATGSQSIISPEFFHLECPEMKWTLSLSEHFPKRHNQESSISIFISCYNKSSNQVSMLVKPAFIDRNKEKHFNADFNFTSMAGTSDKHCLLDHLKISEFFSSNYLTSEGHLSIFCEIKILVEEMNDTEEELKKKVSVDNCIEMIQLAEKCSMLRLSTTAREFFCQHVAEVKETNSWNKVKEDDLFWLCELLTSVNLTKSMMWTPQDEMDISIQITSSNCLDLIKLAEENGLLILGFHARKFFIKNANEIRISESWKKIKEENPFWLGELLTATHQELSNSFEEELTKQLNAKNCLEFLLLSEDNSFHRLAKNALDLFRHNIQEIMASESWTRYKENHATWLCQLLQATNSLDFVSKRK